jgi:hypothetical protein
MNEGVSRCLSCCDVGCHVGLCGHLPTGREVAVVVAPRKQGIGVGLCRVFGRQALTCLPAATYRLGWNSRYSVWENHHVEQVVVTSREIFFSCRGGSHRPHWPRRTRKRGAIANLSNGFTD